MKSEVDDICLYIINFEDLTSPPSPVEQPDPGSRLSKCNDYKRSVFRVSARVCCARLFACVDIFFPPTNKEKYTYNNLAFFHALCPR